MATTLKQLKEVEPDDNGDFDLGEVFAATDWGAPYGRETRVGKITFKSMLEAKWYEVLRAPRGSYPVYEKFVYRYDGQDEEGYARHCQWRPDFVLFKSRRFARAATENWQCAGCPHIEVKPTEDEPPNQMWTYSGPIVQICGYPDSAPTFFIVTYERRVWHNARGRKCVAHDMKRDRVPTLALALAKASDDPAYWSSIDFPGLSGVGTAVGRADAG